MISLSVCPQRITPKDQNWFFGYYDIPAFDCTNSKHLALNVPFMDRLPKADDIARLNVIDIKTGKTDCFAETTAWNFQQACMLQWHPVECDSVIYNIRNNETECGYGSVIQSLTSGKKSLLDRPVANVAPDGQYAVSVNFDRLFDFRPGYGYAGQKDYYFDINYARDDGVFLVDLSTGSSRMILSLEEIWGFVGSYFKGDDQKICINHITFNRGSNRILMLVRNFSSNTQ